MMTYEFLKPHFRGERFQGTSIPLEVLRDLAVLEEMVIEVAKWRYLKDNPGRSRSPRGFCDGIQLKLTGIEDGSAIPVITLVLAGSLGIFPVGKDYFEKARDSIVEAIGAAEHNESATNHMPETCLGYFDRFGRSLREGEVIEFVIPSRTAPVQLTKETRRRLVLASSIPEITDEISLSGSVPEADQCHMTFQLQLTDGKKIQGPIPTQYLGDIIKAFSGYKRGRRVELKGIGKFNRQNNLESLESVEHVSVFDPLDISARLDEFRLLNNGWLDGKGNAPSQAGLDWLISSFSARYPDTLPLPYLYPTAEGGVQAEWSLSCNDVSVDVDLESHKGNWHSLELSTGKEATKELDLDLETEWDWLVSEIRRTKGEAK